MLAEDGAARQNAVTLFGLMYTASLHAPKMPKPIGAELSDIESDENEKTDVDKHIIPFDLRRRIYDLLKQRRFDKVCCNFYQIITSFIFVKVAIFALGLIDMTLI